MTAKIYYVLLILVIFVQISYCSRCNTQIQNINNCNVWTHQMIPGYSYQCGCVNGCTGFINGSPFNGCYNNTITEPKINVYIPSTCSDSNILISKSVCDELYCPMGCLYEDGQCIPSMPGIICQAQIGWSCPNGCTYRTYTNSCLPDGTNNVCDLVKETYVCPYGCSYNYYIQKCISSDPNYICKLKQKLLCPIGCKLNIRGDTCIPDYIYANTIRPYVGYYCSDGCTYNKNTNTCISNTIYNVCSMGRCLICPNGLIYDNGKCKNKIGTNIICEQVNNPEKNTDCVYDRKDGLYKRKICEPTESRICNYEWPYNIFTDDKYGIYKITYLYKDRLKYKDINCKYTKNGECENKRNTTQCSPI